MSKIRSIFGTDPNIRDFERRFWRKAELHKSAGRKIGSEKKVCEKPKKVFIIIDENGPHFPRNTKARISYKEFNKKQYGNVFIFIKHGLSVNVNETLLGAQGCAKR